MAGQGEATQAWLGVAWRDTVWQGNARLRLSYHPALGQLGAGQFQPCDRGCITQTTKTHEH